jgi:hypothetical protein
VIVVGAGLFLGRLAVFEIGQNLSGIRRLLALIAVFLLVGLYQWDRFVHHPA